MVVGVSPDSVEALAAFRSENKLPFTLLSDTDHAVTEKYGAWGEKKMYGKSHMGVVRSHFIIDENGRLLDVRIKVSPDESVKLAVEKVTAAS